jgi:hypothetical protein
VLDYFRTFPRSKGLSPRFRGDRKRSRVGIGNAVRQGEECVVRVCVCLCVYVCVCTCACGFGFGWLARPRLCASDMENKFHVLAGGSTLILKKHVAKVVYQFVSRRLERNGSGLATLEAVNGKAFSGSLSSCIPVTSGSHRWPSERAVFALGARAGYTHNRILV